MPYEPPANPGMREAYVLSQLEVIYAMAWLTPWFIDEVNLLLKTDRFIMHLNRISVVRKHRGRRYGHTLLHHICQDADRLGILLTLDVEPDDANDFKWIHLMYEHAGFKDEPELGGMVRWPVPKMNTKS